MTSPNEGPSHGRLVCLTLLIIPCFAICYFEAEQIHEALHSLAERLTLTSEATSNRKQAVPFEDIVDRQPAYLDSTSFDNFDLDGQGCNLRTRDALSAIRRAKTDECKLEIRNLICQIEADPWSFYPSRIDRTCSVNIESAKILGFITLDPSVNFQRIDCPIGLCPDFCFKYGYKYAIYDKNNHSLCYCNHSVGASVNIGTHCEELQCWLLEDTGISSETLRFRIPHVIPPINHSRTSLHLAFLLTVDGRSVRHIRRLIETIYSSKHFYFIHVDSRNSFLHRELVQLESSFPNIKITGMRFPTIWGGSTLLDMMLSSIEQLLRIDHPWEYLINLSESDFPIKPLNDLENYIASYKNGTIFLKSHGLDNYRFIRKQGLDRIFYQCENRMWRLGPRILPSGLIYSGGSDWFVFPRDFCHYLVNNDTDNQHLLGSLKLVFKYSLLPAESFFHTLVMNGQYCNRAVENNLRLTNWRRKEGCKCQHKQVVDWCGCSPSVYRDSDWNKLEMSRTQPIFISRKFDPAISQRIINRVDRELLGNGNTKVTEEDRYWQNYVDHYDKFETQDTLRSNYLLYSKFVARALQANSNDLEFDQLMDDNSQNHLISADMFFKNDAFFGMIASMSTGATNIPDIQILFLHNADSHMKFLGDECKNAGIRSLEVNSLFDIKEKTFRNFFGLIGKSHEIIVYHEWELSSGDKRDVKFKWHDPSGSIKREQFVKLATVDFNASKPIYAHRAALEAPIDTGLWSLIVEYGTVDCIQYDFLVFEDQLNADISDNITDSLIARFYSVRDKCAIQNEEADASDFPGEIALSLRQNGTNIRLCHNTTWSTHAIDLKSVIG